MLISGDVADQDFIDLLKLINSMSYTGVLLINNKLDNTSIVFDNGAITGLSYSSGNGTDYLQILASCNTGKYLFREQEVAGLECDARIDLPTDILFFEIAKKRETVIEKQLFEDDMIFELKPTPYFDILSFSSEEWRVIAVLSEKVSVGQLKTRLSMSGVNLTKILYTLEQSGVIKRIRATRKEVVKESVLNKLRAFIGRILT